MKIGYVGLGSMGGALARRLLVMDRQAGTQVMPAARAARETDR